MVETALNDAPTHTAKQAAQWKFNLCWLVNALAVASLLWVLWNLLTPTKAPTTTTWPEAALLITVAAATLMSLARQLPTQNVILAAAIIGGVGGIAHILGAITGIPFDRFQFADAAGVRLLGMLPWPIPALWIIATLNSRGVARLILWRWRNLSNYGYWLIGLTALLTALFDLALDPFASQVKQCWLWQPTNSLPGWHGAPLGNFIGWLVIALLIQVCATPALINKRTPMPIVSPEYHPLAVWLLSMMLLGIGAFVNELWMAGSFCTIVALLIGRLALRGARKQT